MTMLLRLKFTLLTILFVSQLGIAQDNWKKLSQTGDRLFADGEYLEAGDKYFAAWKMKPKKTELAFKAGDSYYLTRDYNKAIKAYKVVKDNNDDFHHAGFKYARCLKSLEQFDEASREFVFFINNYSGDDYADMSQLVQTEILGCEMAIKDADKFSEGVKITHLSESINSGDMEYAPIPYSDDILYFSSDKSGSSKIYRSQNLDGTWTKSKATDKIFKNLIREHYGNVSFAPDNSRFYFTQCDPTKTSASKCDIYVVESKSDGSWSDPIVLPEYVNDPDATNTQPCVVHTNGKETIYFASNRSGGKGGMDIWYTSRDMNSSSMDFTFPKNVGSRLNTAGDEITPFYDEESSTLYFSSDGHIGYGGFDVYKSQGSDFDWDKPVNMGKPVNSSQDDRYYIFESTPESGFFVSNRKSDLSKLSTTDEDIFHFGEDISELVIKGKLLDSNNAQLTGVKITLYEVSASNQKRIISNKQGIDNQYKFPLIENKAYVLEASKDGYTPSVYEFEVLKGSTSLSQDMILGGGTMDKPVVDATPALPTEPEKPSIDKTEMPPVIPENPIVKTTPVRPDIEDEPKEIVEAVIEDNTTPTPPTNPAEEEETTFIDDPKDKPFTTPVSPTPPPTVENVKPIETVMDPPKPAPTVVENPTPVNPPVHVDHHQHSDPPPYNPPANPSVSNNNHSSSTVSSSSSSNPQALDPSWYPNHGSGSSTSSNTSSSSTSYTSTDYNASSSYQPGTYYKIQMEAMKSYNPNKYSMMNQIGTVETEGIPEKNLVRILLGNYYNKEDAIAARNEARGSGFDRAYVVKYKDGKRVAIKVFYND